MHRLVIRIFAACCLFALTRCAVADGIEFPYEAAVSDASAIVRCGPGQEYYGTSQLRQGERVRVRRHDPDGWFMIDPPADSFSLVRADDVEHTGKLGTAGNLGTVRQIEEGQVSVRVGSALDPNADRIFQRRLSPGEQVEILGLVTILRKDREIAMYKVRPPRGEYRWIEAGSLTAVDPRIQDLIARDSSIAPPRRSNSPPNASAVSTPEREVAPGEVIVPQRQQPLRESGTPQKTPSTAVARTLGGSSRAAFDEFVKLTTETSRRDAELAAIQSAYAPQNTRPPASVPSFTRGATEPSANSRAEAGNAAGPTTLPALDVPVPQDTPPVKPSEEPQIDPPPSSAPDPPAAPPETKPIEVPVAPPAAAPADPQPPAVQPPAVQPPVVETPPFEQQPAPAMTTPALPSNPVELAQPSEIPEDAPQAAPASPPVHSLSPPAPDVGGSMRMAPPRQVRPPGGPALDGAGIVQRSATAGNTPRHVLVAPNGKILAYLHPERGVSLEPYVGRPMGIIGNRAYRQELQADLIVVHSLVPVRLVE